MRHLLRVARDNVRLAPALVCLLLPWELQADVTAFALTEFNQVSWLAPDGTAAVPNSLWGRATFQYTPDATDIWYANLSARTPSGSAWLVQNLALFPGAAPEALSANVDLGLLGLTEGTLLSTVDLLLTVSATPVSSMAGDFTTASVTPSDWYAWSDDELTEPVVGESGPGRPAGSTAAGAVTDASGDRDIRAVQEEDSQCFPGATARSLDWLNRKYHLGSTKNAQQFYDALKTAFGTKTKSERIEAKSDYAKTLKVGTKVYDLSPYDSWKVTAKGVGKADTTAVTLKDWLKNEFRTEDVELTYWAIVNGEYKAHILTLTRVYEQDGKLKVRYREDEAQGRAAGDANPVDGEIYLKDGVWRFGADNLRVWYLMSESVPEPSAWILGATVAVAVGLVERRRRRLLPGCTEVAERR